jgi:hypothetical protein
MQPVYRQRIGKHVPAATNTKTTIELLLETVFLLGPRKVVIRKTIGATQFVKTHVEAESNTSTETLRCVGGDERGTQCLEV